MDPPPLRKYQRLSTTMCIPLVFIYISNFKLGQCLKLPTPGSHAGLLGVLEMNHVLFHFHIIWQTIKISHFCLLEKKKNLYFFFFLKDSAKVSPLLEYLPYIP